MWSTSLNPPKNGRDPTPTGTKHALHDEKSDSSEGELDMDTDSDEEWNEDSERQAAKRNRALGGFRHSKVQSRSMSLDQKITRSGSLPGQPLLNLQETPESLGVVVRLPQPSSGENILEDPHNEDKGNALHPCSCSCSQSSGCKTKKCECKAAGGLCGTQCGCNTVKCNNREAVAMEEEQSPLSLAAPVQMEVAQALALAGVDKDCRRLHDQGEAGQLVPGGESLVHIVTEEEHVTKRAERLLAVHGASLLESAWKDELQEIADDDHVRTDEPEQQQQQKLTGPVASDEVVPKRINQRRPLQDIGNKVCPRSFLLSPALLLRLSGL